MMSEDANNVNPFGSGHNFHLELEGQESPKRPNPVNKPRMIPQASPGQASPGGDVGIIHPMVGGGGGLMCGVRQLDGTQLADMGSKLESLKSWSLSTYKCTRQAITEKLGKAQRTVDLEIENQIEALRNNQAQYQELLALTRGYAGFFGSMVQLQKQMADTLTGLWNVEPRIKEELAKNAATQRLIAQNGESLLAALNFFTSSLATLCDKTIEDTLTTVKNFETARLEYDAYRGDLALCQSGGGSGPEAGLRLREAEAACAEHKLRYEQLREDVQVKIRFLEENRTKVMSKQLLLFHNAITAYFTGNQAGLEATLKYTLSSP